MYSSDLSFLFYLMYLFYDVYNKAICSNKILFSHSKYSVYQLLFDFVFQRNIFELRIIPFKGEMVIY
jgi:hypothetical protein